MIGLLIQLTIALMGGDGVEVTFERQIRPIIAKHCSRCHQPDQGTPFSLLTYRDVRKRSRQILAVVESRFMPPWLPAPGDEPFVGARRLSRSEIDLIRSWVAGGAREGQQVEPRDGPSGPSGPSMSGLGAPDVVLTSTEPLVVPAEGLGVVPTLVR